MECDIKHLSSYFKEVKARLNKALEKAEVSNIIGIFQKYFAINKEEEEFNDETFIEIMDLLIEELNKAHFKDANLKTKLKMAENLYRYFGPHVDFGLFYERENEELEDFRSRFPELRV